MDDLRWAIKYSPKTWKDLLLPAEKGTRNLVKSLFETGRIPTSALLLHGVGGTGKSTFIDMLAKEERWFEHTLSTHGEGKSSLEGLKRTLEVSAFNGRRWLIRGDEIDKSTVDFLDGLRSLIDANDKRSKDDKVLFVFSSNHFDTLVSKAPEVFDGERVIDMNWDLISSEEILQKCKSILQIENKATVETYKIAEAIVERFKPKLRRCLNELQLAVEGNE